MTTTLRAALAALFALAAAGAASAQPELSVNAGRDGSVTRTVRVGYDDLNLAHAAGRERLAQRIERATRQACGYSDMYGMRQPAGYVRCHEEAYPAAMAQVDQLVASNSTATLSAR